jgi:ribosomal protein S18 acetylase RimI-like enzyme
MLVRPTSGDDADGLLALVHACDIAAVGFPDFDMSEVVHALKAPLSLAAQAADGSLVGWVFIDPAGEERDWLDLYMHPCDGQQARQPLLEAGMKVARERGKEIRAGAVPTETAWIAALGEAGFEFLKQYARMTVDLPAALEPVPGVSVRPVRQEELPEFHHIIDTAFLDAPDYNRRTYEQWRERWIDDHLVHWDEWLVAEIDGELAGALQSKSGDEGWVQNLAVLREHRRRGVGRALLGAAFGIYAGKGYPTAGLGVDLANPTQAVKLYTGAGMTDAYRANVYVLKPVGAAGPSA